MFPKPISVYILPLLPLHNVLSRKKSASLYTQTSHLSWSIQSLVTLPLVLSLATILIMHLAYPILTVLAFEIIAITATRDLLIPTPGVQPRSPVKISLRDLAIEERQNGGPAQKVLVACPEMFNEPPVACAACGGESPDRPGKCKIPNASSWYCACMSSIVPVILPLIGHGCTLVNCYYR